MARVGRPVAVLAVTVIVAAGAGLGAPTGVLADTVLSFPASADTHVNSSSVSSNHGKDSTLKIREGDGSSSDPNYRAYLRFDVSGLSGPATGVTLRLSVSDTSPHTQSVYAVAGGWTETGLTYANAPSIGGSALGTGTLDAAGIRDIVLDPSSVPGDGSVWLAIRSSGTNSAIVSSREGGAPPLLIVSVGGGGPPPALRPVAAFGGSPLSGSAPRTVRFSDASTNGPTSWTWDFGDPGSGSANVSSVQNPSHVYADPGTYDVTLTASNVNGSSDPLTKLDYVTITTGPPPPPPPSGDAVLVGAGDIADCGRTEDSKTEALLAGIPGTVFATGDLVYPNGTTADFANCYGPTWGLEKARTRPIVGNHEYNTSNAAPYYAYWGAAAGDPTKGYYSYDIGAWHAIVLNANCSKVGGCNAGSAQERWLLADLKASSAQCTIAFWHQARFTSSRTSPDGATLPLWQDLYDYGAEIVVNGHYHNYERFAAQTPAGVADPSTGIREFVVGTGGAGLSGFKSVVMANSQVRDRSTYGVLKLTLHDDGYDWRFIPIAGQSFSDSGSADCHGRP